MEILHLKYFCDLMSTVYMQFGAINIYLKMSCDAIIIIVQATKVMIL